MNSFNLYQVVSNDTCYDENSDYESSQIFLTEENAVQYIEQIFLGKIFVKSNWFKYSDYRIQYLVYDENLKRFILNREKFYRHLTDFRNDFPPRKTWIQNKKKNYT